METNFFGMWIVADLEVGFVMHGTVFLILVPCFSKKNVYKEA